jgi:site-specific DNA-methyltransferase (adenine-specific)
VVAKRRQPGAPNTTPRAFGAGRREKHESDEFYQRFDPPIVDEESLPQHPTIVDRLICRDAANMSELADNSVALIVTSPPYFVGKTYEEEIAAGRPDTYIAYLKQLTDVLTECVRVLEPGGRIAINVANLGRRPYRSLSSDVITILQDQLGLLLRGEIIWQKAEGATSSCAWGSYRKAANPVLRDTTERIIVASKGRFTRAIETKKRLTSDWPATSTIGADEFLQATLDVWTLSPINASHVGHPAPFPVELPRRLIELYTFADDLVVDPYIGSGSTALAALQTGRHYVGYDTQPEYLQLAQQRLDQLAASIAAPTTAQPTQDSRWDVVTKLIDEGASIRTVAEAWISAAGLEILSKNGTNDDLVTSAYRCVEADGVVTHVELAGTLAVDPRGLTKQTVVYELIAKAALIKASEPDARFVVLSTEAPKRHSTNDRMIRAALREHMIDQIVDLQNLSI